MANNDYEIKISETGGEDVVLAFGKITSSVSEATKAAVAFADRSAASTTKVGKLESTLKTGAQAASSFAANFGSATKAANLGANEAASALTVLDNEALRAADSLRKTGTAIKQTEAATVKAADNLADKIKSSTTPVLKGFDDAVGSLKDTNNSLNLELNKTPPAANKGTDALVPLGEQLKAVAGVGAAATAAVLGLALAINEDLTPAAAKNAGIMASFAGVLSNLGPYGQLAAAGVYAVTAAMVFLQGKTKEVSNAVDGPFQIAWKKMTDGFKTTKDRIQELVSKEGLGGLTERFLILGSPAQVRAMQALNNNIRTTTASILTLQTALLNAGTEFDIARARDEVTVAIRKRNHLEGMIRTLKNTFTGEVLSRTGQLANVDALLQEASNDVDQKILAHQKLVHDTENYEANLKSKNKAVSELVDLEDKRDKLELKVTGKKNVALKAEIDYEKTLAKLREDALAGRSAMDRADAASALRRTKEAEAAAKTYEETELANLPSLKDVLGPPITQADIIDPSFDFEGFFDTMGSVAVDAIDAFGKSFIQASFAALAAGENFKAVANAALESLTFQAAAESAYQFAKGLAYTAANFFFPTPNLAAAAATAFASAAAFGAIGGIAAVGTAATGGFGGGSSGGGSSGGGSNPSRDLGSDRASSGGGPVTNTYIIQNSGVVGLSSQLARTFAEGTRQQNIRQGGIKTNTRRN